MDTRQVLAAGQAAARARMTSTCLVQHETGRTIQDENTGRELPVLADLFTSPCRVKATEGLGVRTAEAGGREQVETRAEIHLPLDTAPVPVGALIKITAVAALTDVQLVGRSFRVEGPFSATDATARRLPVSEVVA